MDIETIKELVLKPGNSPRISTKEMIKKLKSKPVLLYGAGLFGQLISSKLLKLGVKVEAFIDIKGIDGMVINGLNVYHPDDKYLLTLKDSRKVIISVGSNVSDFEKIGPNLMSKGLTDIISAYELVIFYGLVSNMDKEDYKFQGYQLVKDNLENIEKCYNLAGDKLSRETFARFIYGFLTADCNQFIEPIGDTQYTIKDIIPSKSYQRFIDCGAFTGDTILSLIKEGISFEKIAAFEPTLESFKKLSQFAAESTDRIKESVLFPCGVWSTTLTMRFSSDAGASSGVSSIGDTFIQCVAIDDVLHDFKPTFVKMDIEGAEPDALIGCNRTIHNYQPVLAICIYHDLRHIWEVMLLLQSWNLGYKFYLRAYACGFETVLFAVPNWINE